MQCRHIGCATRTRDHIELDRIGACDLYVNIAVSRLGHDFLRIYFEQSPSRPDANIGLNVQKAQVHVDGHIPAGRHRQAVRMQTQAVQVEVEVGKACHFTQSQRVACHRQTAFGSAGLWRLQIQFRHACPLHGIALASHDDTTVAHVEQAHAEGASMSEFPTTVLAAQTARGKGLLNVMGGPNVVRGGSHSGNVAAATLARQGLLDILSSDYVPGSLLGAVFRLHQEGILDLPSAVRTVTLNPARATGLNDRGALQIGQRADLIQVRPVRLGNGQEHAVVRAVWRGGEKIL